jgi:Zn-dependent protease
MGNPREVDHSMLRSLNLGKFFGIDVYVHPTFWILPLFVLLRGIDKGEITAQITFDILLVFAVFACIVLHEIGHALAARAYGIGTRNITLFPIGGVASLERMPEKPSREIAIALAGPAVNLVIAGALFVGLLGASVLVTPNLSVITHNPFTLFAINVLVANVILFAFNLLPAFPMDGGRVLRALLATRMTRLRATSVAAQVGTVVAIGIGLYGLLQNPMEINLVVLAVAVYLLGQAELGAVRLRETGRALRDRVEDYFHPSEEAGSRSPHGPPTPGFSGLAWDATRRVWVEWKNGVAVGSLPSAR